MESARERVVQRLLRLAGLVVERGDLDGEVVAVADEVEVLLQACQPCFGWDARASQQLVEFGEHAPVLRVGLERGFVAGDGLLGIAADVVVRDAQVAPRDGEAGRAFDGDFPLRDGLFGALFVVVEVAQVVGDVGVVGGE